MYADAKCWRYLNSNIKRIVGDRREAEFRHALLCECRPREESCDRERVSLHPFLSPEGFDFYRPAVREPYEISIW